MNELVFLQNDQALTTSLKVAEYFEKNHQHVMRDIRRIIGQTEGDVSFDGMFREATYVDKYGREKPMYTMTRDGFSLLVMSFTGAKALKFKLAIANSIGGAPTMHEEIIDGRKYRVCDTVEETFVAFFGEESGRRMLKIMDAITEPQLKCVYLVEFDHGWCKIGVTKDFSKRLKSLTNSSGATPIRWCHTTILPAKDAYKIEKTCHQKFAPYRLEGEFFNIPYKDARAELGKYSPIAAASPDGA